MTALLEDRIPHHIFRYIEKELYDYPVHKRTLETTKELQEALVQSSPAREDDGPTRGPGEVSDSTSSLALKSLSLQRRIETALSHVQPVEAVMATLVSEDRRLIELRYFHVDGFMDNIAVGRELNMSPATVKRRRSVIFRRFAAAMGLPVG